MGQIIINRNNYSGNNISINNGVIMIDGKKVTPKDEKIITISVEGNVEELTVDNCKSCVIKGDAGNVKTMSGNIKYKK
jgi:hypothetical protein